MCFLYGVVGGMMGIAWTQVISAYMIFSPIGLWLERKSTYLKYGKRRHVITNEDAVDYNTTPLDWDERLPWYRKILKGIACIYCVSTWFTILTYILFPITPPVHGIMIHFIGLVSAIGVNMVMALIICILRELPS